MEKDYGKGHFKVYPDMQTGTLAIGRVRGDGAVRDHLGRCLYTIEGDKVFDMSGGLYGVIQGAGDNAMALDPDNEDCSRLLFVLDNA